MAYCSAKNFDKLLPRQNALEKQLNSMEAKLRPVEIKLEVNAGYGKETTLPMTWKVQEPVQSQSEATEQCYPITEAWNGKDT